MELPFTCKPPNRAVIFIKFLRHAGYTLFHADSQTFVRSARPNQPLVYMGDDGLFYLDITGGDLASLIRDLANKAGYGIVIYSHVHGSVGTMQLYGVTFEEALDTLLRGTTFAFKESEGMYVVGEAVTVRPDSPELTEVRIIPLRHLQPSELTSILPPSIPAQSIRPVPGQNAIAAFGGERLLTAIEEFVASVDVPQPSVIPQIVTLKHVTADEVATVLARAFPAQSFQLLQSQNALLLTGSDQVNERILAYVQAMDVPELAARTVVVPLQHIKAEHAKQLLPTSVDASRVLVIDEQNALVISGRDEFIDQVRTYLAEIDVKTPQILFEVMIVEVNDRESLQYGVSSASSDGALKFDLGRHRIAEP